jgi:hypothetical protein
MHPLELGAAAIFAALFVLTSLLSTWVTMEFGIAGVYSLAAVIGITDIDPFEPLVLLLVNTDCFQFSRSFGLLRLILSARMLEIDRSRHHLLFDGMTSQGASPRNCFRVTCSNVPIYNEWYPRSVQSKLKHSQFRWERCTH